MSRKHMLFVEEVWQEAAHTCTGTGGIPSGLPDLKITAWSTHVRSEVVPYCWVQLQAAVQIKIWWEYMPQGG